jgi:hypothetical protein
MGLGSGIRDPVSGKNLFRIPDPGVKKAPDLRLEEILFFSKAGITEYEISYNMVL